MVGYIIKLLRRPSWILFSPYSKAETIKASAPCLRELLFHALLWVLWKFKAELKVLGTSHFRRNPVLTSQLQDRVEKGLAPRVRGNLGLHFSFYT